VQPQARDFRVTVPAPSRTFPSPLPPYLHRISSAPSVAPVVTDPASANAGRFSLSLKGMRKRLRKSGARAEELVRVVENELMEWLAGNTGQPILPSGWEEVGRPIDKEGAIKELSRSPLKVIWAVEDAFARYVVHCTARFHSIVSFSKDPPDGPGTGRLLHLLRPNTTRPDWHARSTLDTPPITDLSSDYSTTFESEDSDLASDRDAKSELGDVEEEGPSSKLTSSVTVQLLPRGAVDDTVRAGPKAPDLDLDVEGGDADLSEDDYSMLQDSVSSLTLLDPTSPPKTSTLGPSPLGGISSRSRRSEGASTRLMGRSRSKSSPSPSARTRTRQGRRVDSLLQQDARGGQPLRVPVGVADGKGLGDDYGPAGHLSFWEFLFG